MVTVNWKGARVFEADPPSGVKFVLDAHKEFGGQGLGPTPVETLLGALAACSAMDVIAILEKKRQKVTAYRIEVEGDRDPPGTWPRPFKSIVVRHILSGENLDAGAIESAVKLSDERYCTVITTLRSSPKVTSEWQIVE